MNVSELDGYAYDELAVGMSAVYSRTITDTDLRNFSGVSGDTNPMHLNEEYARSTVFGGCIVHGMLTASLLSTVIGTQLPGPGCIYVSQSLRFRAPVHVGETVYARVTVKELQPEKRRVVLQTQCLVNDSVVLDGEAVAQLPERRDRAA